MLNQALKTVTRHVALGCGVLATLSLAAVPVATAGPDASSPSLSTQPAALVTQSGGLDALLHCDQFSSSYFICSGQALGGMAPFTYTWHAGPDVTIDWQSGSAAGITVGSCNSTSSGQLSVTIRDSVGNVDYDETVLPCRGGAGGGGGDGGGPGGLG